MCGAIVFYVMHLNSLSDDQRAFLEDLVSKMGYTIVLTSHYAHERENMEPHGFIPFLKVKNRRTSSDIKFYFKQLQYD